MSKPIVLAILDGYGFKKDSKGNAINKKTSPFITSLIDNGYPHSLLEASGEAVGLPEGQIGNSEVGHLTIGAGRVVYTGLSLINKEIKDHLFEKNKALTLAINFCKLNKSNFHILGLLSPGGVHSHENHIFELIKVLAKNKITPILHIFGDGRDVPPKSMIESINRLNDVIKQNGGTIASIAGRFYAMDRDKRWDRVEKAYNNILGIEGNTFTNVVDYVNQQYEKGNTDEFIESAHLKGFNKFLSNNDVVLFANFRPDRARELSHYIYGSTLYDQNPKIRKSNLFFVNMMDYEGIKPSATLYTSKKLNNVLGEVIANNNLKQLRIAETEKYAHVTFFMDGGVEQNLKNEKKILIPSPKVTTYDLTPEMSAVKITDKLLEVLENFDFVILNFANADMVGHTGNFEKTELAIKCVDSQVKRIYEKLNSLHGTLFITADHGNADEMIDNKNEPITKHSSNPVWFICSDKKIHLEKNGNLSNIAPTILNYMNIKVPVEMDSKSLLLTKKQDK